MKNFVVSAGLVAIGAASVQTLMAQDVGSTPKVWSVSASLRGFYDDNYSTAANKKGSAGVEFTPSISSNVSLQQTDLGVRYTYGLYWYEERQNLGQDAIDQTHQLDFWLDHAFDQRWKGNLGDTFAVGQEPALLQPGVGSAASVPTRVNGNNIANHFNSSLSTQWTRQFSTALSYNADFYDYQNSGNFTSTNGASLAGLLNGVEQNAGIKALWSFQPQTTGFVGYNVDWTLYTAGEAIGTNATQGLTYYSKSRDTVQHQFYVGVQHSFTPNLSGSAQVGATYADSYNVTDQNQTSWSPNANVSLTYTYLPGCYASLGFTHSLNPTDVATVTGSPDLTLYQQSSVIYASINHRITEKLVASVIGQVTLSDYEGAASSEGTDTEYNFGLGLTYSINHYLSADAGYNYDNLQSKISGRGYSRNRVYIGMTASY